MSRKSSKSKKKQVQLPQKYNRNFSETFKRAKVKELVEKRIGVTEFSNLYGVSRAAVYKWIFKYSELEKGTVKVIQMESEAFRTKALLQRVAELERIVGQKQLEIDFLNKTFDLANEEIGYDLKKKYEPKLSNTFDQSINDLKFE